MTATLERNARTQTPESAFTAQLSERPGPRVRRATRIALVVIGFGLTLVTVDGTWWWAVLRVLAIAGVTAAAITIVERGPRLAVATTTIVGGVTATAAGGALAVSYRGTGGSLRLTAGLLTVVAGLVLLVTGTAWTVRSARGWWRRVAAVATVVVLMYSIGFPVAMATFATNVVRPQLGAETPADRGYSFIDVSLPTSDSVTLSGWYIPSSNGAAVVVLHGASSTRSSVLDQSAVLARHGYGVLLFDARGMGRSGGRAMDFGWYGDRDIAAALDYLHTRPEVDPTRIAALGESMGGEEAIGAMAADTRLRAVVAEGATNRVAADWHWLSDRYGVRGALQEGVHWMTYELTDLLTDAHQPIALHDAVALAHRPVLLITAGTVADEANAARDTQHSSPDTVQVWEVPGADHTGGLRTAPAEWEQRVTNFLAGALLARK